MHSNTDSAFLLQECIFEFFFFTLSDSLKILKAHHKFLYVCLYHEWMHAYTYIYTYLE